MLARVLAMALRLCLPQVGSLSHEIDGLRLVFGMEASFDLSCTVL